MNGLGDDSFVSEDDVSGPHVHQFSIKYDPPALFMHFKVKGGGGGQGSKVFVRTVKFKDHHRTSDEQEIQRLADKIIKR
jgi:hypothetical protein